MEWRRPESVWGEVLAMIVLDRGTMLITIEALVPTTGCCSGCLPFEKFAVSDLEYVDED